MRIVWVAHSAQISGAGLTFAESIGVLAGAGHEVHAVLPGDGPLRERLSGAAHVELCHHNPWAGARHGQRALAQQLGYNVAVSVPRIAALMRDVHADVAISDTITTMVGALAARARGVPHAWSIREFATPEHGIEFMLGAAPTLRAMRALAPASLVGSEALRRYFAERLPGMDLHIVSPTVDVGPPRRTRADDATPLRLAVVGFKSPGKRQLDAIRALALVRAAGIDAELELVGGGDPEYVAQLENEVRELELGDRVRLAAATADPFAAICDADVVISCSAREGLGRVLVEAMKAARPVIGARSGATPELVRNDDNGFLYTLGDVAGLAARIHALAADREEAAEMGRRGQAWANATFNAERHLADLERALTAVRAARGPRTNSA